VAALHGQAAIVATLRFDVMETLLVLVLCIAAAAFFAFSKKSQKPPQPPRRIDYAQQLTAVKRPGETLRKKPIMGDGEFQLFRAAMTVTGQPMPSGSYVFPQVSLGEIIQNDPASGSEGQDAYNAIN
jgi:hypothetical protein